MTEQEARELAEAHWKWAESWLHLIFVDAMIHGIKHGQEAKAAYVKLADDQSFPEGVFDYEQHKRIFLEAGWRRVKL